jgi:hypothetical protein
MIARSVLRGALRGAALALCAGLSARRTVPSMACSR